MAVAVLCGECVLSMTTTTTTTGHSRCGARRGPSEKRFAQRLQRARLGRGGVQVTGVNTEERVCGIIHGTRVRGATAADHLVAV